MITVIMTRSVWHFIAWADLSVFRVVDNIKDNVEGDVIKVWNHVV